MTTQTIKTLPPTPYVLICYRRFKDLGHSHVGLGVNGLHTVKVLRANRIGADLAPTWTLEDIRLALTCRPAVTHCVIEAIWLTAAQVADLMGAFPHVKFAVRCHSQLAFLQVEPGAIRLLRQLLALQDGHFQFHVAANSQRFAGFIESAYASDCDLLPNLYWTERADVRTPGDWRMRDTLRIGSFGAIRLMKHHLVAAGAALIVARRLNKDLEFHVNDGRVENGGRSIIDAIRALFEGVPWAKLVLDPWSDWERFRHTIANMHLCFQLSSSETFNLVTADAIAEGVPTVVGQAIDWVPQQWHSRIDDAGHAARVGIQLLHDPRAPEEGVQSLADYVERSLKRWVRWLRRA